MLKGFTSMVSITKILVPVVFSRRCAWAAGYAALLAKNFGAQLVFLNVGEGNNTNALEEFVAKETGTASHKSVVVDGDPASRIIDFAQEYKADLIVMPTYQARFRRFLIGSVTAKVLHDVDCPVLTGVHRYDDSPQAPDIPRTVVCALDNGPGCIPLFHWARDFTAALGARLRLIHALPAVDETSDNRGEVEVRRYLLSKAKKDFSARFATESEPVAVHLHGGDIATVVRESALAERADLVVIGRGHADRTLGRLRTHTYSIIRSSPRPVISV
jgi:nucleotide-binding universal stress UspA family protein